MCNGVRHHLEITVFATIWNTFPSGLFTSLTSVASSYGITWPGLIQNNALKGPSQGRSSRCDPRLLSYFLLDLREDTACSWCSWGVSGWMGQVGLSPDSLPKLIWRRMEHQHISMAGEEQGEACGVQPVWTALSSFPQEGREAGWVWSQGLQLFQCRDKLHLHPEPACGGAGGREDGLSLRWYPPSEGLSRVLKRRLQKSFWFVDTCCSSLKEKNCLYFFFPLPPWATLKPSSPMKTLCRDKRFLVLLKRALLGMTHCTKLKITLENIGNTTTTTTNKEPIWCEKTLCEHIKIGEQGRAFLNRIHKDLLGQSLNIAGPAPAPPLLLPCCRVLPHLLALPHHTVTPLPHELVCQVHPITPTPGNVVVLCVNLGVDWPCSKVRA